MLASSNLFTGFIADRTRNFTGREWVFEKIENWLAEPISSQVFFIVGEPGIGKSSIAARLSQIRELGAVHFCIARQADTLDPLTFSRSISQQLCRFDNFARLIVRDHVRDLSIEQNIEANYGQAIGIKIEKLIIHSHSAQAAFLHTVLEPLRALDPNDFQEPLVILVDSLDEAAQYLGQETIIDLLSSAGQLPAFVRLVLTSRSDEIALRHFEQKKIPYLTLDAGQKENLNDIRVYINQWFVSSGLTGPEPVITKGRQDEFVERILETSGGNFLYVSKLLPALESDIQLLDELKVLPPGLDGVYREFLRTRKVGDIRIWRDYRPLLGVLTVAQAPLTSEQLIRFSGIKPQVVSDFIIDVGQFLDPVLAHEGRYQLYHQSLVDFLNNKERAGEFWLDPDTWHSQIIESIRGTVRSWDEIDWNSADEYDIRYLTNHIYSISSSTETGRWLFELINYNYMREKHNLTRSHRAFASEVDHAIQFARQGKSFDLLQVIRACMLHPILVKISTDVNPKMLVALAQLDHQGLEAALDIIQIIQDPTQKSEALIAVASNLPLGTLKDKQSNILHEALTASEHILDRKIRVEVLTRIAQLLIEIGEKEDGLSVLDQVLSVAANIEDEKTNVQVKTAQWIAGLELFDKSLAVAEAIEAPERRAWVLLDIAKALWEAGKSEESEAIIKQILALTDSLPKEGDQIWTLIELGDFLMQKGKGDLAQNILDRASELAKKPGSDLYPFKLNSILPYIDAARAGKYEQAQTLTREAVSWEDFQHHFGEAPDVWHDLAIRLLMATGHEQVRDSVERALTEASKLSEISKYGHGHVWTAIDIAKVCRQAGEFESTLRVLDQVLEWMGEIDDQWDQYLIEIALIMAGIEEYDRSLEILSQILEIDESDSQKIKHLLKLAELMEQKGEHEHYPKVLYQILQIVEHTENIEAIQYSAQFLAQAGKNEHSRNILSQINKMEGNANQKTSDLLHAALVMAEKGGIDHIDIQGDVAQILIWLGDRDLAKKIISQSLRREEFYKFTEFKGEEAAINSHIMAMEGDIDQSLALVEQIKDPCLKAQTLVQIVQASLHGGAISKAQTVCDQAIQMAGEISRNSNCIKILGYLAQIMAGSGQSDKALEAAIQFEHYKLKAQKLDDYDPSLLSSMHYKDLDLARSVDFQCSTFSSLHQSFIAIYQGTQQGREFIIPQILAQDSILQSALNILGSIDNELIRAKASSGLVKAFLLAEKREQEQGISLPDRTMGKASIEQTLLAARQISNLEYQAWVLSDLVKALLKAGKEGEIPSLLNQIENPIAQALVLKEMSRDSDRMEITGRDLNFLAQALAAAQRIDSTSRKAEILAGLAQDLAQSGEQEQALAVLNQTITEMKQIESSEQRLHVLSLQAQTFNLMNEYSQAKSVCDQIIQIAEKIENPEAKVENFCKVAQLFAEANYKNESRLILVRALDLARLISRDSVLKVLFSVINWIHKLEAPDFAWRIYETIVEIDGWWVLDNPEINVF